MNIDKLDIETKKRILKSLQSGKFNKSILKSMNVDEVTTLLTKPYALISVKMGDIISYTFYGKNIDKAEFERLSELSDMLGIERKPINSTFNIEVIKSPIPLANDEKDIII